jgi:hypothetical protein
MGEKRDVYQHVLVTSIEFQVNEGWKKVVYQFEAPKGGGLTPAQGNAPGKRFR